MQSRNTPTWRRWLLACSFGAIASVPALAQQAADERADDMEAVEEVLVTGSYIKRSAQDSASPLTVISSVDI